MAGLTTAYRLARDGASVVLLDRDRRREGQTALTTAHLASALDDRFYELERLHSEEGARLAAASHGAAIDFIEATVRDYGIDCGFRRLDAFLFLHQGGSLDELRAEEAAAARAGLSVEMLDNAPAAPFATGPCLRFPRQAQFQPVRYLEGLAGVAQASGVRLFGHTHVASLQGGASAEVVTDAGHRVSAGAVVVATNVPFNDRVKVHTWLEAYRSYVIALTLPRGAMPPALLWDTGDPYHYVRLQEGPADESDDLLIVGGEDHKTGQGPGDPVEPYLRLAAWTRDRFPMAGPVVHRWSGQVIEPVDSLALIGRNPLDAENVYIITGDSGNGMTHGTLGGLLIRDLIRGVPNRWAELYRPARITVRAAGEYARHNANVLGQYGDWLSPGEVASAEDVAPGTGAVVRSGLTKRAVYRDQDGRVHTCSAVCPHLRGLVRWNSAEGTWDCPAHGSRFDAHGRVINGPANEDLEKVDEPALQGEPVTAL